MTTIKHHVSGRVLLLEWSGPVDGSETAHLPAATQAVTGEARFVLLDMTQAAYADTEGLRWLFRLREQTWSAGKRLRIAARRGGKVWRNLALFVQDLEIFGSVSQAWAAPWPYEESAPWPYEKSLSKFAPGDHRAARTESGPATFRFGFRSPPSDTHAQRETLIGTKEL